MRIAVFIKATTFHDGYGGLETQNKSLCEGLVSRGHDVLVFSPQKELKFETKYENGVKYHFVPSVYRLARFNKENWFYKSQEAFLEFHEEVPFDLVISQSSAGLGIIAAKKKYGVPIVSISHGTIIGELKTRLQDVTGIKGYLKLLRDTLFVLKVFFGRQRNFVHGSDKVIAVSSAVKEALINETFAAESKITVINNGIDAAKIKAAEAKEFDSKYEKKILYVGQIIKTKGLETLLKLANEAEFSSVGFEIVGSGEYLEDLKEKVHSLDISDRFRLHGKLPYEEVLSYFKAPNLSLFAFPTERVEGFPMVLVESLFAGLPVVAYDIGGVSDAVINSETGFLVEKGDYAAFKEKIKELLQKPELQKKLSEKCKMYAKSELTLQSMLDKYEVVFTEVINKK